MGNPIFCVLFRDGTRRNKTTYLCPKRKKSLQANPINKQNSVFFKDDTKGF